MALTITNADVIVCTLAVALKVNLAANFVPAMVILDEAARCIEFKTTIFFALYNPIVFMLAADYNYIRLYIASANQGRDNTYVNPF